MCLLSLYNNNTSITWTGHSCLANHNFSGGQAKTLMFVHISPEPEALGETLSTLKFAERVSTVELGAARVNKDAESKELKEQVFYFLFE